jgi:hypothetical protein
MKDKMKDSLESDDLEDIPVGYMWYPVLAIMAMVAVAIAVVISIVLRA